MQTYLECYTCFVRMAIEAGFLVGANEEQQRQIVKESLRILLDAPFEMKPPQLGDPIHRKVREITGNADPYLKLKQQSTQQALQMIPDLKQKIHSSKDPLETAVRLSVAGNIMDFGVRKEFDLDFVVEQVLTQPFAYWDYPCLREALQKTPWVLYLADNSGETVFDRLLIEQLKVPVYYVVKSGPIINDATRVEAISAGIDQVATIIECGSDTPGTFLERSSEEFLNLYHTAAVIIAKGQAQYEMLSEEGPRLFFLLQAKCAILARDLNVPQDSFVVKQG